ncbi:MAG: HD-GYP domain-containing protein [Burkholderiales bacterium]|nr:HD-GYP domain-containing protein [Burkholderiales bacterium]
MHVHKFAGSWLDHPFWRNRFTLESAADLQSIRASAIREVWIDVGKGSDVDEAAVSRAASAMSVSAQGPAQARTDAPAQALAPAFASEAAAAPRRSDTRPAGRIEELERAATIVKHAKTAVSQMFNEARMGRAIDQTVAKEVAEEIADSVMRNGGALISLARLKTADDYTYMHSVAVCALMVALARQLGLDEAQTRQAGFGGLLHDLGKMDVAAEILNKPGKLSAAEFELVKRHPRSGHRRMVEAGIADQVALDVCLHHHERIDGAGYPDGLRGEQLSLFARMGAVCDIYDAVTSNRPYKAGWNPAESIQRMAEWVGPHLDKRVFQAFVRSLGIYPVGSLLLLASGKLAVVVEQSADSLLKPVVKTVYSVRHQEPLPPARVDLSHRACRETIVGREDPAKWPIPHLDELWQSDL